VQCHHHIAYHIKQSNDKEKEKIQLRPPIRLGENPSLPRVNQISNYKKEPRWGFRWQETDIATGKRVERLILKIGDKPLKTQKEAEKARDLFIKIHPFFQQKENILKVKDLICQINADINLIEVEEAYHLIKKIFPRI